MNQHLKQHSLHLLILIAIATSLFATFKANSNENVKATPTAVGVVDWLNMTDQLDIWKTIKVDLKDRQDALIAEMDLKAQEITSKREELKILPPDSPAADTATAELRNLMAQTNAWADVQKSSVAEEELTKQLELYQHIVAAVEIVAKRDGWDLVLWNDAPSKEININLLTQSAQLISSRQVFYASDAIDITDTVIAYMNTNPLPALGENDQ